MKPISFFTSYKAVYIEIFKRFKTKILPVPIPLVNKLIIKLFNRQVPREFDFSNVKSVLFRTGGGVGDSVVLTAGMYTLKQAYPNIKIGVIVTDRYKAVYENNPVVDVLVKHNLISYLKNRKKWEVFVDLLPYFCEANIIYDAILSPKYVIDIYKFPDDYYFKKGFKNYNFYTNFDTNMHINRVLELTPFKKYVQGKEIKYFLNIEDDIVKKVETIWDKNKIRVLLNSSGTSRSIERNLFTNIILEIQKQFGDKVDLVLLNNRKNKKFFGIKNLKHTKKLSLKEFIAMAKSSDIIITADTSLVHIAGAFDKYLIAFYSNIGDTNLWLPINKEKQKAFISKYTDRIKDLDDFKIEEILSCFQSFISKIKK